MVEKRVIDPGWQWDENFPLSQGLRVGNLLFLSGQVAVDSDGTIVGRGDLKAQTRQVFENIKTILGKAGATFDNVVKMTTYLTTDIRDYEDYFAVRREYFTGINPASTGVQVAALAFEGLLLEVEVIAYLDS
jgi:reactive intermediate/imine deaminase